MHEAVFHAAALWMTGLLVLGVVAVIRTGSALGRVLALDMVVLVLVALLVLYASARRTAYYLDAALALALVSLVATIAAARYHSEREGPYS